MDRNDTSRGEGLDHLDFYLECIVLSRKKSYIATPTETLDYLLLLYIYHDRKI